MRRCVRRVRMSNFDEKFGPAPVRVVEELRPLVVQFVVVVAAASVLQPVALHVPQTTVLSVRLTMLFACAVATATVALHRSFIR